MTDPNSPPAPTSGVDSTTATEDLRLRLAGALAGEQAARREVRRLARELALSRRLLNFYVGSLPAERPAPSAASSDAGTDTVLWSVPLTYHLDTCEDLGAHTTISGWGFCPVPGWDARATRVTVLLRHEDTVYATPCRPVRRTDVAAFYAGQPPGAGGGAVGLEGVGFACDIRHDALPAGADWKVVLRLECAAQACEQFTGEFLRL